MIPANNAGDRPATEEPLERSICQARNSSNVCGRSQTQTHETGQDQEQELGVEGLSTNVCVGLDMDII
jgi:hypothetical protein